jgi:Aspartyl protease
VLKYLYAGLTFGLLGSPALSIPRALTATNVPAALSTVPFRYVHHEILVNVRIGKSGPYTFMLDTGTTPSVVDAALAKRLGNRALQRYAVTFDYVRGLLTIAPPAPGCPVFNRERSM